MPFKTTDIPTIDVSALSSDDPAAFREVAALLGTAARDYGFMKLVNHGVSRHVVTNALVAAAEFFSQPDETKQRSKDQRNNRGFQQMYDIADRNGKPSAIETFSVGHPQPPADAALLALPFHAPTPWPQMSGFRERIEAIFNELFDVGALAMRAFACELDLPPDTFDRVLVDTYSSMRINHYPPQEHVQDVTDIGLHAHADKGLITLLIQDDKGGLFVQARDGRWIPVVPDAESIILNIGNLMTRWTNGRYLSAMHMVKNSSKAERYSIPLFMHPSFHQVIDPRQFFAHEAPRYEPLAAGQEVYASFARERVSWKATNPA